jgi:alpha/beta superfamily hydrolase
MKKITLLFLLAMIASVVTFAQADRYTKAVFTDVKSTKNITYCENYSFEPFLFGGKNTKKVSLKCDFYEPAGDKETKRPLVIFLHTGNFVPQPTFGGSTQGRTSDSVLVEVATRLSKMGYACASADYRIGWAPTSTSETTRKFTLINAAYRGVQDIRSCIRFFKKNADKYGIDTSRVVVWGNGTGGYIAYGAATLNTYPEIFANTRPAGKFMATPTIPMVIEAFNGNINGTSLGIAAVDGLGVPKGDTLCIPSNVGPTSDFQLAVSIGGAIGDISWLDSKSIPMISYHNVLDAYAPYKEAVLKVPVSATVIFDIVNVMGGYEVQKKQDSLGLNVKWKSKKLADAYSKRANEANNGYDGLFPVRDIKPTDGPWDWWDAAYWNTVPHPSVAGATVHQVSLSTQPLMSATRARTYIDTLVGYFSPRAYLQLDLDKKMPAPTVKVTFSVDMGKETVDAAKGVCVAGNFQKDAGFADDWKPGTTKLTKRGTTNIYEYTANLPSGKAYEYKFINDNDWKGLEEKMTGKGCYPGDNRAFTVGTGATQNEGTYVYNSCAKVATNDAAFDKGIQLFPNPTAGELTLNYNFDQDFGTINVRITNSLGQVVVNRDLQSATSTFNMNNMSDGIYLVHISNGAKFSTRRIVVQK